MRLLWTQPLVSFEGRWHTIPDAGINPLPVQRPIPVWFGGSAEQALQRIARIGDGWMVNFKTAADARPALNRLQRYLEESGRSPDAFGLEPRLSYGRGDPAAWGSWLEEWQAAGATHASLNTMGLGFQTPAEHMKAIEDFAHRMRI
jgi:alkanesulfonate monooxygenase SsuD/methylene tetrahydromethanopterin reductase-like flavin-dependent oxidoreductase (luciferase family)